MVKNLTHKLEHLGTMQVEMVNAIIPYKQKFPSYMDNDENIKMLTRLRQVHQNAKIIAQWIKCDHTAEPVSI